MDDDFFGEPAAAAPVESAAPAAFSEGDDDFFGGGDGATETAPPTAGAGDDDMFGDDGFGAPPPAATSPVEAEDVVTEEVEEPTAVQADAEVEVEVEAEPVQEAAVAVDAPAPPAAAEPEEEVEQEVPPLVKWEMENREIMARRDQDAADKLAKMHGEAKESIDQFNAERTEMVSGNHERNVGAEAEFCKQRDALFSHGDVWERVVSLIDLKASNDKKQSRVSRMRSLLLHMKNEAK